MEYIMEKTKVIALDAYRMMYKPSKSIIYIACALFDDPIDELPRFKNAWIEKINDHVHLVVLARVGKKYHGKKQVMGESVDQNVYMNHPDFVKFLDGYNGYYNGETFFDDTFGRYYFNLPSEWEQDFYLLLAGKNYDDISDAFKCKLSRMYPKLVKSLKKVTIKLETEKEIHENHIDISKILK